MRGKHKAKFNLRKSKADAFLLQTQDISETSLFFTTHPKRDNLSHYLNLGGAKTAREEAESLLFRQSMQRFFCVITILVLVWLIGFFLP